MASIPQRELPVVDLNTGKMNLEWYAALKRLVSEASGGVDSFEGRSGTVVGAAGDYTASEITNVPAGTIAATNVQTALNELDSEKLSAAAAATTYQPLDGELTSIAADETNGFLARVGNDTIASRSLAAPAAGITIGNPAGTAGDPTFALANDLAALEAMAGTGLVARTAAETYAQRTIAGTANEITLANGGGVAGNPTVSLPTALTFTGKTVTGGTFTDMAAASITGNVAAPVQLVVDNDSNAVNAEAGVQLRGGTLSEVRLYANPDDGAGGLFAGVGDMAFTTDAGDIVFDEGDDGTDFRISGGDVFWPALGTTTAAPSAYIDSATGEMLRSTLPSGSQLLASVAFSGATTVSIVLTSFTAFYAFELHVDLLPSTDGADINLLFSTNGGSSHDNGVGNYSYGLIGILDASATVFGVVNGSATAILLCGDVGSATTEGVTLKLTLTNLTSTARHSGATWTAKLRDNAGTPQTGFYTGGGHREAAQDTDAIRIQSDGGNIAGNYRLIGYR